MYGLILENIASYIRNTYGHNVWQEVMYVANIEEASFAVGQTYSEGLAQRIVWATRDVTDTSSDELMERIGESFYEFTSQYEYNKILRVLGRSFPDFLNALDNLHEFLRFSYPKLRPPSFYCEHESKTGLTLHYRSKRRGFLHYVKGQIKAIAKDLYDTDVKIELLDRETEDNMEHVILRLHFNNVAFQKHSAVGDQEEEHIQSLIQITSDIFFDIFPFIVVFNRGMRIRNIGMALMRLQPKLIGKKINHEFVLLRPLVKFRWENLTLYSNNVFEIMSIEPLWDDGKVPQYRTTDISEIEEERRRMPAEDRVRYLILKGQMIYMEQWESICFLAIPVLEDLKQMNRAGLFINDFAMHDSSRDLVLAGTQQAAEIKLLLDQEAQKLERIEDSMRKLEQEQERTDSLLYQLLPQTVAEKIRSGSDIMSTCENFDSVSVIFTDIVGFTILCSRIQPMAVVKFLNSLYSLFDGLTEKHNVYKVETIGDAYMIVSGAPTRNNFHAEFACDCCLAMLSAVANIVEESSKQKIIGIHTGSVVAGVVGLKMPRYCLFGDTVIIANKMESSGQAMRIQLSETTKQANEKEKGSANQFKYAPFTTFEWKAGKKFATFWLEGKRGVARPAPPTH